jgi:glycosyltransferase involved in cell wall biosynthesis
VPDTPVASVLIPTRDRADYLDVSLASIMPQAAELGAEVIVVSDGPDPATAEVAQRHGARHLALPEPRGANASRNAGVAASSAPLVLFVDDDVEAPAGWLSAMLEGVLANPEHDVFGGPIRPRFEGGARACGRHPPITNLDLGTSECDADFVWSANMAVRRAALERVGPFDETIHRRGDEEDWERRYIAGGGAIRYLPAAGLDHRRSAADSRLLSLAQAEYQVGRAARRWDTRKGTAPPLQTDTRWLLRWGLHTVRRRCPHGIVSAAHYVGRLREALSEVRHTASPA